MNSNDLAKEFLTLANKYVGVSEEPFGSNRGDLIDKWNRQSNVPLGSFGAAHLFLLLVKSFKMLIILTGLCLLLLIVTWFIAGQENDS